MKTTVALLVNSLAGSGRAEAIGGKVRKMLERDSIDFVMFDRNWPTHLSDYKYVMLVGGDGTLNFFVNKYDHEDSLPPLLLFKGGTGNDFAWKLYRDADAESIYNRLFKHEFIAADVGICNGKSFINGVGIGFDGAVVKSMSKGKKKSAGHLTYFLVVLKKILFYREAEMSVEAEGLQERSKVFMLTIANGARFGGGFMVSPQSVIHDGLLDVVRIRRLPWFKRVIHLPKIERGTHLRLPFVSHFRSVKITISSNATLPAHIDGEAIEECQYYIELAERKILFLV